MTTSSARFHDIFQNDGGTTTLAAPHTMCVLSNSGSSNDRYAVEVGVDSVLNGFVTSSAGNDAFATVAGDVHDDVSRTYEMNYGADDLEVVFGGTTGSADTTLDLPTDVNTLHVGSDETNSQHFGFPVRIKLIGKE